MGKLLNPGRSQRPRTWKELVASLWARALADGTGCWMWQGCFDPKTGYAQVTWRPRRLSVHRLAWEATKGPIPPGKMVCHSCDRRLCVNPEHLFLSNHQGNMADMVAKGRQCRGPRHPKAILDEPMIELIRAETARGVRQVDLAALCGVAQTTISAVIRGETWRHVEGARA